MHGVRTKRPASLKDRNTAGGAAPWMQLTLFSGEIVSVATCQLSGNGELI
jgi:hypothetical protein